MICTYTANAGFLLIGKEILVAVDAFPLEPARGFSALAPDDFQALLQQDFSNRRLYVITTHDHPDHYSPEGTGAFLAAHPHARFIGAVTPDRLPTARGNDPILLKSEQPTYYLQGLTLEFARLTHEGEEFAAIPNYGCLMTFQEAPARRIVLLGDAKPADPAIADWLAGRPIDWAFFNFPWICLPRARRFLEQAIAPAHIAVIHLPYEQTDRNHYLDVTRKAAGLYRPQDTVLLTRFGQQFSL